MGGLCLGMERAGFKTLWANEFNEDCLTVYRANFLETNLIGGDIREISVKANNLQPVDVLHGGFPCQSFSGAGNRLGFNDERGMLFSRLLGLSRNLRTRNQKF